MKKGATSILLSMLMIITCFSVPTIPGNESTDNWNIIPIGSCQTTLPATKLVVQGNYVFVITAGPSSGAFHVVDVTNPQTPTIIGTITNLQHPIDITIQDNFCYIVDVQSSYYGVFKIDVSDPYHPSIVKGTNIQYPLADSNVALTIHTDSLYIYHNKTVDIYKIPSLTLLTTFPVYLYSHDLIVDTNYLYLVGGRSVQGAIHAFKIIDVSNPFHPVNVSEKSCRHAMSMTLTTLTDHGRYMYLSYSDGVQIFNITDFTNVSQQIEYYLDWQSVFVASDPEYLYVSLGPYGLDVFDISDPVSDPINPLQSGFYNTSGNLSSVCIKGSYLYLADGEAGIPILQLLRMPTTPETPTGPFEGDIGIANEYTVTIPDDITTEVSVLFNWGDNTDSGWLGPYHAGDRITSSHSWVQANEYDIRVKIRDTVEGFWSFPLRVYIGNSNWWPRFHKDEHNTGYTNTTIPDFLKITWEKTFDEFHDSIYNMGLTSPRIVDGNIYVGLNFDYLLPPHPDDHRLVCLDATTGQMKWNFCPGNGISIGDSIVVYNNKVYFGFNHWNENEQYLSQLFCLNATTGNQLWNRSTQSWIEASPTVYKGKLYFGTAGGVDQTPTMYCIDATDGTIVWQESFEIYLGSVFTSSPAVANDKLYIVTDWGLGRAEEVLCLNAFNGTPIWRYVLEEPINVDGAKCSPAIVDDNLIIVTSTSYHGNMVYCLDTEGNGDGTTHLHWEKTLIYDATANAFSPSIAYGYAYVSSISSDITGTIYCLNTTTGDTVWSRVLGAELIPSGISIADGKLYLGTYGFPLDTTSTIFCLDAFTGTPIWSFPLEPTGGVCASPAIANGRVYFSTFRMVSAGVENPRVICFGDENHQPQTPEKPLGPETGETGESYLFSTTTIDDDGDPVRYGWDWDGNGIVDDWTDYYPSGENVPISHTWTDEGIYHVQVQAQDIYEVESSWSESLAIQIGSLTLSATFVSGKGVNLLITNSGTIPATTVEWSLDITGGLYIKPRDASGSLPLLNPGASAEVTVPVFGFGFGIFKPLPQISITVTCAEGKSMELSENARIFLSFVFFIEPKA